MEEIKYKVIIKYSRQGAASFASHLDMQRTFARAMRRADIKVEYSKGFNPHIVMSFASPLSVGYSTVGDYLEIFVTRADEAKSMKERLNEVLPESIRILDVHIPKAMNKKLMAQNASAKYKLSYACLDDISYGKIMSGLKKIVSLASYEALDRRGKTVDIRPMILEADFGEGQEIVVMLKNASQGALNPLVLVNALFSESDILGDCNICRLDCFAMQDGKLIPFSDI